MRNLSDNNRGKLAFGGRPLRLGALEPLAATEHAEVDRAVSLIFFGTGSANSMFSLSSPIFFQFSFSFALVLFDFSFFPLAGSGGMASTSSKLCSDLSSSPLNKLGSCTFFTLDSFFRGGGGAFGASFLLGAAAGPILTGNSAEADFALCLGLVDAVVGLDKVT